MTVKRPVELRLLDKLRETETGCLEFTGCRNHRGYGLIGQDGKNRSTHRVAWEVSFGPIPAGLQVCHRCDNPPCCNPVHLFLGTIQDNMLDASAKGRLRAGTHCKHGHEYTPENTLTVKGRSGRVCRQCKHAAQRREWDKHCAETPPSSFGPPRRPRTEVRS